MERKVREATRNEPWGPTGCQLNELTEASLDSQNCSVIYAVLVFRMKYPPEKWRNVYKALQVLEFILKRGSEYGVAEAKEEFPEHLEPLTRFTYIGPDGRDYGINVRVRAAAVEKLLQDDALLKQERKKSQTFGAKLKGYTRAEMREQTNADDFTRANSWAGDEVVRSDVSETCIPPSTSPLNRGAGEMKGVSLEDNKKYLAELKIIMARPENKICADCGGQMATWASINCGVFICLRCSGIHRGLGVHISKVRSCTLDTWLPTQVQFLSQTGNAVANAYWEAKRQSQSRPVGDMALRTFIHEKYAQRRFASGTWPPESFKAEAAAVPSSSQRNGESVGAASSRSLQIGPRKVADHCTPSDLLKFEDEAFSFPEVSADQDCVGSPVMAEVVAEEAAGTPGHRTQLSFESSALFEQRSSFIRLRSRVQSGQVSMSDSLPPSVPGRKTPTRSDRRDSEDEKVIQTTVLDFDELESLSETMSLASSRILFPGFLARQQSLTSTSTPKIQVSRPSTPESVTSPPPQANGTAAEPQKAEAEAEAEAAQQKEEPPCSPPAPILDLLDAPMAVLPSPNAQGLDALADPFSFMADMEPVTIVRNAAFEEEPESPAESFAGVQQTPEPGTWTGDVQSTESPGKTVLSPKNDRGGLPMNQYTSGNPMNLNEAEMKSIQDLSRLDQLFVQQIEDFLHFGYNASVYHKPSYL